MNVRALRRKWDFDGTVSRHFPRGLISILSVVAWPDSVYVYRHNLQRSLFSTITVVTFRFTYIEQRLAKQKEHRIVALLITRVLWFVSKSLKCKNSQDPILERAFQTLNNITYSLLLNVIEHVSMFFLVATSRHVRLSTHVKYWFVMLLSWKFCGKHAHFLAGYSCVALTDRWRCIIDLL